MDLNLDLVTKGATNLFDKPKYAKYYVAVQESDGAIIGMMMIHHEMRPQVGGLIHWINSVYVHPDHRKKGVFRALYNRIF